MEYGGRFIINFISSEAMSFYILLFGCILQLNIPDKENYYGFTTA